MAEEQQLNLEPLKRWANMNLPPDSHLRAILDVEKTHMPPREYIDKIPTWLKLAYLETNKR